MGTRRWSREDSLTTAKLVAPLLGAPRWHGSILRPLVAAYTDLYQTLLVHGQ